METTKNLALGVLVLLFATFIISCTEKKQKTATLEELGQMNRDFAKALVAKDATAAANLYDENASLLPPNEPIVTGRENIKKYWQGAIDAGLIAASVKTIDASSDGALGYEIGTFELKFQGKDGTIITDIGKYTEVLKRNSEGKWISIYGMWSANEAVK
jgi:ketosteroid isomerase-like protein